MFQDTNSLALAYYISEWAVRIAMLVIVPFRRTPEAARSWLLLVLFLPWPALFLYLLIGRPTFPRWRRKRFLELPEILQITANKIAQKTAIEEPDISSRAARAAVLVQNLGRLPVLDNNSVDLLSDYDATIDCLVADIDAAKDSVHLLFYIFASDETGARVIAALGRAQARGVACRVLIDALGSRDWARDVMRAMKAHGIAAHLMLPVSFFRRKSARADLRNHRKIAVFDGRIAYAGSQNIVDAEFSPGMVNKELMVRVTGPIVLELQAIFIADWFLETDEVLQADALLPVPGKAGEVAAQVLPSGPDYPEAGIENLIVALIHSAREKLIIATPYFVPSEPLLRALQTAALRGVKVYLILSQLADHHLVRLAQRSYYSELMAMGVRIRLYRDQFLHAKNMAIDDDIAVIGSSNVDIRSFVLNSEVTMVFYDKNVAASLAAEHERYVANSALLSPSEWEERSMLVKIAENLGRLVSPLL